MEISPNNSNTSLASLRLGERALVVDINAQTSQLGAKLAARGLVPGVEVGVLRAGDPLLVVVDEARWALTRSDANNIEVDPIVAPKQSFLKRLLSR